MTDRPFVLAVALAGLLAACGGSPPSAPAHQPQPPAELLTGDVTLRATTLITTQLTPAMAAEYGVDADSGDVLLVIGLRRGDATAESAVTGRIRAQATDLLGRRTQVSLREVRSNGFVDYVGTVPVSLPETLRFEINATPDGAPPATLRFHRDFFP